MIDVTSEISRSQASAALNVTIDSATLSSKNNENSYATTIAPIEDTINVYGESSEAVTEETAVVTEQSATEILPMSSREETTTTSAIAIDHILVFNVTLPQPPTSGELST